MQQPHYVAYPKRLTESYHYVAPANYQQGSPPFVNQSFDRFNGAQKTILPYRYISHPIQRPQGQHRLPKPGQPMSTSTANDRSPHRHKHAQQSQPHEVHQYKSNDATAKIPPPPPPAPIKGPVSNHHGDQLSKHKGQNMKTAQMYRISRTEGGRNAQGFDSTDDEYEQIPLDSALSHTLKQASLPKAPSASDQEHCPTCGSHIPTHLHNLQKYLNNE